MTWMWCSWLSLMNLHVLQQSTLGNRYLYVGANNKHYQGKQVGPDISTPWATVHLAQLLSQ